MSELIKVDGDRLWNSLMEMAQIGGLENGGCNRQALTDEDKAGRDLFIDWCKSQGCTIKIDAIGNIFARRAGTDETLDPIVMGSHLDTQPTGGKFDGVYGVLAGVEVLRTLNDHNIETKAPVEVAVWTNEEGARFDPALVGSGVYSGVFDLEYGLGRTDKDGKTIGEEVKRIGYAGDMAVGSNKIGAHFEVHIEQGPILEAEKKTIGVVKGIQGMYWYELAVIGDETHAGPNPMNMRNDPVQAMLPVLPKIYDLALATRPEARVTIGKMEALPGSINTVPGQVKMTVDIRHPDAAELDVMRDELLAIIAEANTGAATFDLKEIWYLPPTEFDPQQVDAVRKAAAAHPYPSMEIYGGAGHDSVYINRVAPTAMIFVPCEEGISHNEAESAEPADLEAGCNILLHAVCTAANA